MNLFNLPNPEDTEEVSYDETPDVYNELEEDTDDELVADDDELLDDEDDISTDLDDEDEDFVDAEENDDDEI